MKVKALVSFACAECSAYVGEVVDLKNDLVKELLKCGYVEKITTKKKVAKNEDQRVNK